MSSIIYSTKAFQLKAKDVAFEALFDLFPINFSWIDTEGYVLGCNQRVLDSLKLHSFNDIIGKHTVDVASELAWENTKKVLRTGKTLLTEEVHFDDGGSKIYFLSIKSPIKSRQGKVLGAVNIAVDITDRKQAETDLKEAKEAAQLADKVKTEFLMNMRHDIRTPLTGIIGFAELIKEQANNAKITEYATHLLASSNSLLDFLNEILEIINLTSEKRFLLQEKFNLKAILNKLINLNQPKAKQKNLKLTFHCAADIPTYLVGDSHRIQKILMELLSNAIKFTHQGTVHMSAQLAKEAQQSAILKIIIQDTGTGIPDEQKTLIFSKFNRLHPTYEGRYGGLGMGLALVKQYIEDMGGEIYLESMFGKGSTFACVLPLKKPLLADDFGLAEPHSDKLVVKSNVLTLKPSPSKHYISDATAENKLRVLLVEDSALAALATKQMLIHLGCAVDIAEDGETAIKLVDMNVYDLIFMDIGLPDMSGHKVTEIIRSKENLSHIPILALTAHEESNEKQTCITSGMNAVYIKPLHKETAQDIFSAFVPKKSLTLIKPYLPTQLTGNVIDFDASMELTDKDNGFAKEMLELLVDSFPEELVALKKAYQNRDWQALQAINHRLKGCVSYCGTPRLTIACSQLDTCLKSEKMNTQRDALYHQLIEEIENVKTAFAALE